MTAESFSSRFGRFRRSRGPVTYWVTNRDGATFENADARIMAAVLAELDGPSDDEHPDVSLTHESEWTLSVFEDGLVTWENVAEDDEPRHRRSLPPAEILRLWQTLAAGDIDAIEARDWQPGYS